MLRAGRMESPQWSWDVQTPAAPVLHGQVELGPSEVHSPVPTQTLKNYSLSFTNPFAKFLSLRLTGSFLPAFSLE